MRFLRFIFVILCYTPTALSIYAQQLDAVGKQKPFALSGGVALNQIIYGVQGIEYRRDPYLYVASGNLNLSLYGWSVPLSFSVSNQNASFQQPFNQYSMHPSYKSVTGHIGYTSMSYSPYTVNGHIFLGAAVDVAPEGRWNFSGLYGRFLKPVERDTSKSSAVVPAFKRMGYGFKSGYNDGKNTADIIVFYAKDDIHSIRPLPDSVQVLPQENLVLSLGAGTTLFNNIIVRAELATSTLTRDTRAEKTENSENSFIPDFLFTNRVSSSVYTAHKTSVTYQQPKYTIGVAYERIAPQYTTLGAYFFNNDLENITLNTSTSLYQGKINITASGGTQRDNLDESKVSTLKRIVGSVNINYAPSQRFNMSGSYSTFQSFTNIRSQFVDINQLTPYDNLDTLSFTQLSKNATLSAIYSFGSDTKKQSISTNFAFQNAADTQGGVPQNSGMQFYNVNTIYTFNIVPQNMTLSVSINASMNEGAGTDTKMYGPTAAVSRSFFEKKLRATLSSSFNSTYTNGTQGNNVWNNRLGGTWSIRKKHALNVTLVVVNRKNQIEGGSNSFTEFTGTIGYSYNFALK